LTISDNITKLAPKSNFTPINQVAKQRTIEPQNADILSEAKSLPYQIRGGKATQGKFTLSDRSSSMFSSKTKRVLSPMRIHSSDYGDDDFNDLISPSILLGEPDTGFARSGSPMIDTPDRNSFKAISGTTKKPEISSAPSAAQAGSSLGSQTKPLTPPTQHDVIEIRDDTPPEYEKRAVSVHRIIPKQDTLPVTMDRDTARSLKRKASQINPRSEESQDRSRRRSSISSFMMQPLKYMAGDLPLPSRREISPFHMPETDIDLTAEWLNDDTSDLRCNFKDSIDSD
jgi:hypothetical protein